MAPIKQFAAIFIGLLLATPTSAQAASFDCSRASSDVEKRICADVELGRLDDDIAQAYTRQLASLDARYQSKFREVQRSWLATRSPRDELALQMQDRLKELNNAVVTVNSLTFLSMNGFHRPPYLLTSLPGSAAYNHWVDQIWIAAKQDDADLKQIMKCERFYAEQANGPRIPENRRECEDLSTMSRVYSVDFASPDLLGVEEMLSQFEWHAAHPANSSSHVNWWLSKPGRIKVNEIFPSRTHAKTIRDAVLQYRGDQDQPHEADVAAEALKPGNWELRPDHLQITGQGYDYNQGRGPARIDIPWSEFGDALAPHFLSLLKKAQPVTDPRLNIPIE